jgi:hypothetical protein
MIKSETNYKRNSALTVIGIVFLILGTVIYYIIKLEDDRKLELGDYAFLLAIFLVIAFTIILLLSQKREYDMGLPIVDELTLKAAHKAGYYSWIITVWISISIMMFKDLIVRIFDLSELTAEHQTGILVFSSILVFFMLSYYFTKRGEVD